MNDAQFLRALECGELLPQEFGHSAHLRAAYLYLQEHGFVDGLQRICRAIGNYTRHIGKPERYHETITVAYVVLIHQHMVEPGDPGDWVRFAEQNADLFKQDLLLEFYPQAQLESALARRVFLLPRLKPKLSSACLDDLRP
jgi:hypothetical protein